MAFESIETCLVGNLKKIALFIQLLTSLLLLRLFVFQMWGWGFFPPELIWPHFYPNETDISVL